MFQKSIFLFAFLFLITSCTTAENTPPTEWTSGGTSTGQYATGLTESKKINLALDRRKEVRNIRKGDYMTLKNNPESAVSYYLAVLERLPDDVIVKRKLAHAYYLMKDWKNAYTRYSQVPLSELKEEEYKELFQSLFFDDARPERLTELSRYTLDTNTQDYYKIVDACYGGIHNCIVTIEAYSGMTTKINELKDTIKQSTQVSPDFQYRNFLVATTFFKQGMYRAVDLLSKEILDKRPNYIEVRKLRGFALYELGLNTSARDILLSYLEQNPKDLETIIRLGEIYYRLGDYATSNLYLNNAVTNGYPKKTEIERRLAYNYAAMQDYPSMIKVLSYLLQESDASEDDYAVAISLALQNGENVKAYAWSYSGMERFKNSEILTPLYLQSLRANGKTTEALSYIDSLGDAYKNNPLIALEKAISLYDVGKYDDAESLFLSLVELDSSSEWSDEANNYIMIIASLKTQQSTFSNTNAITPQ